MTSTAMQPKPMTGIGRNHRETRTRWTPPTMRATQTYTQTTVTHARRTSSWWRGSRMDPPDVSGEPFAVGARGVLDDERDDLLLPMRVTVHAAVAVEDEGDATLR